VDGRKIRLRLRVSPGASRSEVVGRYGDAWKVRVAAAPEGGRANDAVLTLVAAQLRIPRSRIELVAGNTSRDKTVVVHGLDEEELEARLAARAEVA
jgi:uncharacterized protein